MFLSLIYFFAPFSIFYIPHNYVIPQAMPHAIPQTHSAFHPHRRVTSERKISRRIMEQNSSSDLYLDEFKPVSFQS